ncbi:MAG TPA: ankyrin repeat domain-containing protein [Terriglobales bacterium]|nr:ankyrin repeat domain-containing protein [Terriglobales bacterium]
MLHFGAYLRAVALTAIFLTAAHSLGDTRPVIVLSRSECHGPCPAYTVSVFDDGRVEWKGAFMVATRGQAVGFMTREQVATLIQAFQDIGFSRLNDSYLKRCSSERICVTVVDASSTRITLSQNGTDKTIAFLNEFAPPELVLLARFIDRTTNTHQWIHNQNIRVSPDQRRYENNFPEDLKSQPTLLMDVAYHQGVTPLMERATSTNSDWLKQALAESDLNIADEAGWTALMYAAVGGSAETVETLLRSGAAADLADRNGDTALIGAAAQYSRPRVIAALLAARATVDRANNNGETALMWAAWAGSPEVVQILLAAGADACRTDHEGHDARFYINRSLKVLHENSTERPRFERTLEILHKAECKE